MQGLFNLSSESRPAESQQDDRAKTNSGVSESKSLPTLPSDGPPEPSTTQDRPLDANGSFAEKALPAMPALESQPASETTPAARDPHQRASLSLPPSVSSISLMPDRFYSQAQPADDLSSAQHTRVQSQPMMLATPLSPVAPSESDKSGSHSPRMHELEEKGSEKEQESRLSQDQVPASGHEKPERADLPYTEHLAEPKAQPLQEQNTEAETLPQPVLIPNLSVRSRKPVASQPESSTAIEATAPKTITVSSTSMLSTHPHRNNEARVLNEITEPVELAMTKDDSSEEIVMSPTSYPGQEWTPMHI